MKHVRGSSLVGLCRRIGSSAANVARTLGLIEFCEQYEIIEFWFDPASERSTATDLAARLFPFLSGDSGKVDICVIVDFELIDAYAKTSLDAGGCRSSRSLVGELEVASSAWQAYRATTPEACFDLLGTDLSALPLLRPALLDLLEELPSSATGLGATEMRLLELIARGIRAHECALPSPGTFAGGAFSTRGEIGFLLDGLAYGPTPAVAGLDDELRTLSRDNLRRPRCCLQAKQIVADRVRQGRCRARGRLQPAQSDRSLVGRHATDQ